ncbi:DUF3667 domain-containing protein [Cesiribacter andamanensis]|uniref:DUF3667 domain-containing protein n=1 Tax=Cesiribacter andamanensis AMV16 TaxID=1279009 RepID=M7NP73_9BACT|nr:DUF3667 domain-containing protein [Cesiribacter andamanensis]EMR03525.1 hypothetical protein ADICEAN_01292 [Cesiribacter andamanensis AMV16]
METVIQPELSAKPLAAEIHHCIHCGEAVTTPYCGSCGQRKGVPKLSWASLLHELGTRWLGFDNQFARTWRDLSLRPGRVIHCYLAGDRVRYLGPFSYYIVVTALVLLLISLLNIDIEAMMLSNNQAMSPEASSSKSLEMQQKIMHYISLAFRFFAIIMLPFFALALRWVYGRQKHNLLEYATIVLYGLAHTFVLSLFQGILFITTGKPYTVLALLLNIVYFAFLITDSLSPRKNGKAILKAVWGYVVGYLLFMGGILLVSLLLGVIVGVYMGYVQS